MGSLLPLLLLILLAAANADTIWYNDCPTNMNYTSGGAFQANLTDLLSSLPAAAAKAEFAERTSGEVPDEAYGLAQCRPDANASLCRACLEASVSDMAINIKCPGQKTSMLLYDHCLLRYNNRSFFGVADTDVVNYWLTPWNKEQPAQLNSRLVELM